MNSIVLIFILMATMENGQIEPVVGYASEKKCEEAKSYSEKFFRGTKFECKPTALFNGDEE